VRVRIIETPHEPDLEGLKLDQLKPGAVLNLSPDLGTWLVVQGYAYPDMRRAEDEGPGGFHGRDRRRHD
jgi:hypothetical protein